MTRLLVLSDLHLEHDPAWSLPETFPPFDVAVFAGDVDGSPERAVHRLAAAPGLAGRPIVYVPGNHEFYHGCIEERLAAGQAACGGTRVHLLDRRSVVLDGVRFIGATLWTDYRLFGDSRFAMEVCRRELNDHRQIKIGPPGSRRPFRPEDAAALHAGDRVFLEAELAHPFSGPTVVITHHAPHSGSVAARYARDPRTPGFVSDLGDLIRKGRPALWIHGHVHDGFDYMADATRVIANPKGYGPRRCGGPLENAAFDPHLIVDVADAEGCGPESLAVLAASDPLTFEIACWTLIRMRVGGDRHLLGYRVEGGRGRTTSPVLSFDRAKRTATTASGNRYVLVGDASEDGLDDPLVRHWLAAHGLSRHDVEVIGIENL